MIQSEREKSREITAETMIREEIRRKTGEESAGVKEKEGQGEGAKEQAKEEERQGEGAKEQAKEETRERLNLKEKEEAAQIKEDRMREMGQLTLEANENRYRIHLLSVIGEVEGHECLASNLKSTKYDHVLPQLAAIEDDKKIQGLLMLINTVGGDVEAGLAISEMVASLSIPTVSLVLGGSHSIGVPLAVSTDYSFIVPTATMMIHPVRMSGMVIGVRQSYDYFKRIQDRIVGFIIHHSNIKEERVLKLMMDTETLTRDVGSILVGKEAVEEGLIDELGGIKEALQKLYSMIDR